MPVVESQSSQLEGCILNANSPQIVSADVLERLVKTRKKSQSLDSSQIRYVENVVFKDIVNESVETDLFDELSFNEVFGESSKSAQNLVSSAPSIENMLDANKVSRPYNDFEVKIIVNQSISSSMEEWGFFVSESPTSPQSRSPMCWVSR